MEEFVTKVYNSEEKNFILKMAADMEEFITKVYKSEKKKKKKNNDEWKWEEEFQKPLEQRVYNNYPWSQQGNQRTNVETGTTVTIPYEDDRLDNLIQEIIPFYKELGTELEVCNAKIEEIAWDHIQYRSIKDKAFQVLMAWFDKPPRDSLKYEKLSTALKDLGKGRLAQKYC